MRAVSQEAQLAVLAGITPSLGYKARSGTYAFIGAALALLGFYFLNKIMFSHVKTQVGAYILQRVGDTQPSQMRPFYSDTT